MQAPERGWDTLSGTADKVRCLWYYFIHQLL